MLQVGVILRMTCGELMPWQDAADAFKGVVDVKEEMAASIDYSRYSMASSGMHADPLFLNEVVAFFCVPPLTNFAGRASGQAVPYIPAVRTHGEPAYFAQLHSSRVHWHESCAQEHPGHDVVSYLSHAVEEPNQYSLRSLILTSMNSCAHSSLYLGIARA